VCGGGGLLHECTHLPEAWRDLRRAGLGTKITSSPNDANPRSRAKATPSFTRVTIPKDNGWTFFLSAGALASVLKRICEGGGGVTRKGGVQREKAERVRGSRLWGEVGAERCKYTGERVGGK